MATATKGKQGIINHIALVLDASSSMQQHRAKLIKVVDDLVKNLAKQVIGDQETRVSVYRFSDADKVECIYYDKDVLRLPSIAEHYKTDGWTALNDGTLKAVQDLQKYPELYGDHANLVFVLTDGKENVSRNRIEVLRSVVTVLPDNWTMCALVPKSTGYDSFYGGPASGKVWAKQAGFHDGNVMEWDTTSAQGITDVGVALSNATTAYATMRETGVRSATGLFSTKADVLNEENLLAAGATRLTGKYQLVQARGTAPKLKTQDFVEGLGLKYRNGMLFYQLIKNEKIQPEKDLLVLHKKSRKVWQGTAAIRKVVGLSDAQQSVKPDVNDEYALLVQSQAPNRHVVEYQEFALLDESTVPQS